MALKLTLKPGEKLAVNGAVIVNGDRRAEIRVENRARILREADIMQPDAATSPARRIYYAVMMIVLEPERAQHWRDEFAVRLTEFAQVVRAPAVLSNCARVSAHVANDDGYKALSACRDLIAYENERLAHVS